MEEAIKNNPAHVVFALTYVFAFIWLFICVWASKKGGGI